MDGRILRVSREAFPLARASPSVAGTRQERASELRYILNKKASVVTMSCPEKKLALSNLSLVSINPLFSSHSKM